MAKVKKVLNLAFIRFILVGITNTGNYYVTYLLLHVLWDIHYMIAHIVGFVISFVISFFLNVYFTFRVKPTFAKFLKFPLTQFFNMGVSAFFVFVFVAYFHIDSTMAPILSVFITVPFTFLITGKILKK